MLSNVSPYQTNDNPEKAIHSLQWYIHRRRRSLTKKAVDEDSRPGQYLLIGSTNIRSLPTVIESLAGRIAKIRLRPLAQGEIERTASRFIDSAFKQSFSRHHTHYDRDALLEIAFRGGFPEPMLLQERGRKGWHTDYVNAILERDLTDL